MIERIDIALPPEVFPESGAGNETAQRAKQQVEEAADKAKRHGENLLAQQKERVVTELNAYSSAARRAASRLEQESDLNLSRYIGGAATRLDELSHHVSEKNLGELWDEVEGMVRRRPEIYYGGMFLAGLAAARFLKASRRKRMRSQFQASGGEPSPQPAAGGASVGPYPVPGFPSGGSAAFPESVSVLEKQTTIHPETPSHG